MDRIDMLKAKIAMYFADQCGLTRLEMLEISQDDDLADWFETCGMVSYFSRPGEVVAA